MVRSTNPRKKVLIVEDCRLGSPATGKIGIHEGDLPRTAVVIMGGQTDDGD